MSQEKVVILSLGQLVPWDIKGLSKKFAEILNCKAGAWCSEILFQLALSKDFRRNDGFIGKYNRGELNEDEFYKGLNSQFPRDGVTKDEFFLAWNESYKIKPDSVEELKNLVKLQQDNGLNIVIASVTNDLHYKRIIKQFKDEKIEFDPNKTFIELSFEKENINYNVLAWNAMEREGLSEGNILSLHDAINAGPHGKKMPISIARNGNVCRAIVDHFQLPEQEFYVDVFVGDNEVRGQSGSFVDSFSAGGHRCSQGYSGYKFDYLGNVEAESHNR